MALFFCLNTHAQTTFPVNGTVEKDVVVTKMVNATIHVDAKTIIENGTLLVQKGMIITVVGQDQAMPDLNGAPVLEEDMNGAHIYPAFIDLHSHFGTPEVKRASWDGRPHIEREGPSLAGWNEAIKSEYSTASHLNFDQEKAKEYHKMGFASVLTHMPDGIARGTGALVHLGENDNTSLINSQAGAFFSFKKGSSRQDYPSSLMGATALLRQTYYDAIWLDEQEIKPEGNLSLDAINNQWEMPAFFDAREKLEILRADAVGDEFDVQYHFFGNGDEYQRVNEIKAAGGSVIIPVDYPNSWDVSDPYLTKMLSYGELKHWEMAPSNAAILAEAGVPFCITSKGCSPKDFLTNLRKAVQRGLTKEQALDALTSYPAELVGAADLLGALKNGMYANFLVCDGDLFQKGSNILETWVRGEKKVIRDRDLIDISGEYNFNIDGDLLTLSVTGSNGEWKAKVQQINKKDTLTQ
ncbi:MAG: amidohydrolase family protein, partial [Bacteroidota bacterium]